MKEQLSPPFGSFLFGKAVGSAKNVLFQFVDGGEIGRCRLKTRGALRWELKKLTQHSFFCVSNMPPHKWT